MDEQTKFVQVVEVRDPDTKLPVEVEIRKLANGLLVGLDGCFLQQMEDGDVLNNPYANGLLVVPADESKPPSIGRLYFTLYDDPTDDGPPVVRGKVSGRVEIYRELLKIFVDGYGDGVSEPGKGFPCCLELVNDRLQLAMFEDINSPDALVIELEGAREDRRKPNGG